MSLSSYQQVGQLHALIRQRHAGDGWIVFEELRRNSWHLETRADAMALGMWRSHRYEVHGYEVKIARADLKRELVDPRKSEGIGMYCHYWWLVVPDVKLIEDLLVPDAWGVLIPAQRGADHVLRVHRKAPRTPKPKAFDAFFVISMIRNALSGWVPKATHNAVAAELNQIKYDKKSDTQEVATRLAQADAELGRLRDSIAKFSAASGVDMGSAWRHGDIGNAVKLALELQHDIGENRVRRDILTLSKAAHELEENARLAAASAVRLRALLTIKDHDPNCQKLRWGNDCSCGAEPRSDVERKTAALSEETA